MQQLAQEHHIRIQGEVEIVKDEDVTQDQIDLMVNLEEEVVEDSSEEQEELVSDLPEEDSIEE